jgi:lipid-A-disaccharide synthase-like uncharacterized protein
MSDDAITDDASLLVEVPSTRVLGLGVGIFLIIFFSICFIVVFLISTPCSVRPKLFWRGFASVSLGMIILLLIYAPRESAYESTDIQIKVSIVVFPAHIQRFAYGALLFAYSVRNMTTLSFHG